MRLTFHLWFAGALMKLTTLAKSLVEDLGYNYHIRLDYPFVVPAKEHLSERRADAVIFSSPIPSIQTAVIGFTNFAASRDNNPSELTNYAYLGAPLLVTSTSETISLYEFRGSAIAQKIDEQPLSSIHSSIWLRERLLDKVESPQLSLQFGSSKDILIQDTRTALSARVGSLMELVHEERSLNEVDAFRVAMAIIRQITLGQDEHLNLTIELRRYARNLAARISGTISFANIPPESVAELYETFAVGADIKRRQGIVYTPAWLARFVISRLPAEAFRSGRAVDPTCGSGTFLVCFLERFVEARARNGKGVTSNTLKQAVLGIDNDPVAIEAARLSLDFFCNAIKINYPVWNLLEQDATNSPVTGEWVVGNLPFGYRTHEGKQDVSSVILENIEDTNKIGRGISIILPDSLAYTHVAGRARELLRSNYQIQEITRLPESAFETSSARTMVVVGRKGRSPREVVVREVTNQDLRSFRSGSYVSKTFISRFPEAPQDPWRFSPFNNEMERAERLGIALREMATVHLGLQIYGNESEVLSTASKKAARPLLIDPSVFSQWTEQSVKSLPDLIGARHQVRRPGPWELFDDEKVIVRVTTVPGSYDRLAAIAAKQGIWFTDKFAGIWLKDSAPSINAIAAYLQTRFVRVWFDTNNPSRKLRVGTLKALPVPKLPAEWWERAGLLVKSNTMARPVSYNGDSGFAFTKNNTKEWSWFDNVVESALGLAPSVGGILDQWISNHQVSNH